MRKKSLIPIFLMILFVSSGCINSCEWDIPELEERYTKINGTYYENRCFEGEYSTYMRANCNNLNSRNQLKAVGCEKEKIMSIPPRLKECCVFYELESKPNIFNKSLQGLR